MLRDSLIYSQLDSHSDSMLTRNMALRVLLADESVTIKKVFQLTLQDFAVEVSNVTVGVDVVQAAEQFKPDIIFADAILPKKSGYDVCREIKNHPQLSAVPVVIIWSGFMELDHAKYKAAGADDNLEKPFDAQKLRAIIKKWVGKTRTQTLSDHLSFPRLPDFVESRPAVPTTTAAPTTAKVTQPPPLVHAPPPPPVTKSWSMDNFAPLEAPPMDSEVDNDNMPASPEPEEFLTVRLPTDPPRPQTTIPGGRSPKATLDDEETDNPWVQKSLSKYKITPPPVPQNETEEDNSELLELDLHSSDQEETAIGHALQKANVTAHAERTPELATPAHPQLSAKQIEDIIRAQSQEVIEKVVWQIVPEIATRIIERELQRLLSERSKL